MTDESMIVGAPEEFPFDPEALAFILLEWDEIVAQRLAALQNETDRPDDEKEYARFNNLQKVMGVINNFHFFLPGGFYRTLAVEYPDSCAPTQDELKLWDRIDVLIESMQLGVIATGSDTYQTPENLNKLARLYVALRKEGFTPKELTT